MAEIAKVQQTDGVKESIKTDISKGEQRDAIKRLEDAVDIVSNSCTIVFSIFSSRYSKEARVQRSGIDTIKYHT